MFSSSYDKAQMKAMYPAVELPKKGHAVKMNTGMHLPHVVIERDTFKYSHGKPMWTVKMYSVQEFEALPKV